jgi:two-component system chemotaxis sensor kinase CheA
MAISHGLISKDQISSTSESEVANAVFLPGFSTAETVTNVSGRGVGLDVVRTNVERIGGKVELSSRLGEATTIKIAIPLTATIMPECLN